MTFRPLGFVSALLILCGLTTTAVAESRMALVIGNSAYKNVVALPNPANDARLMEGLLRDAGFEVISAPDLTQTDMRRILRDFAVNVAAKGTDTVALVYYAGHGIQIEGENYLVPVDARIERAADVAIEAVRLVDVMTALSGLPSRMRIVILDACRNNPFSTINQTSGKGLAIVDAPQGSIVSYSTSPGMEALDGTGADSPFATALTAVAREPNLPIEQALKRVRLAVNKATVGYQTPWESSSLTSDFSFFGSPASAPPTKSATPSTPAAATMPGGPPAAGKPGPGIVTQLSKPPDYWRKQFQGRRVDEVYEIVVLEDQVEAYDVFLSLFASSEYAPRVRALLDRRREMMAWYTAVTVNTVLAFQAFLDRYPNSDLAEDARRLRDRLQTRLQSINLVTNIPGASPPTTPATPAATPVSLPAATCSCPTPGPTPPKKVDTKPPTRTVSKPPRWLPPDTPVEQAGPRGGSPPVSIDIGVPIGGFGGNRGPMMPPAGHDYQRR